MRLSGQTAPDTGGVRRIGPEFVLASPAKGARVAGRNIHRQDPVPEQGVCAVALDLQHRTCTAARASRAESLLGGIDILTEVEALFTLAPHMEILRVRSGRMQACNLQRMPFPMRTIASASAARGGGGRIINMMSPAAHGGGSLSVAYSARRAGVIHWAESAGSNLNARGITVTAIASGGMGAEHQTGVGTVFAGTEDKAPRPTTAEPRTATELADPARLPALAAAACILVQPQDKDGGSSRMN